jgi:NAD(P)-dependent dehydrogenase (short-subunit alcohol dehydrogenase family)
MTGAARSVAVTGALGNLGWKLLCQLAAHSTCKRLVGLDVKEASQLQYDALRAATKGRDVEIEFAACDLTDWRDRRPFRRAKPLPRSIVVRCRCFDGDEL